MPNNKTSKKKTTNSGNVRARKTNTAKTATRDTSVSNAASQNNKVNQSSGLLSLLVLGAALVGFFFLAKFGLEYIFHTKIEFGEPFFIGFGVTFGLIVLWKIINKLSK